MSGTMNTEKAKVNGVEVTEQEKNALDELLAKVNMEQADNDAQFRVLDAELTSEIVGTLRGHFATNLIYNIPRFSARAGKSHPECDLIEGGCPYKNQRPHIHILGVGYQGALTAFRAYGNMSAKVKDTPTVVEQGDKLYWAAYGEAVDRHTGADLGRWYMEPVMRKAGNGYIENEFGASIAQSKALRNVILALIPAKLMEGWIDDYRAGKKSFDVQRAKDMGYGPEKKKDPPPREQPQQTQERPRTVQTPGERNLAEVMEKLAPKLDTDKKTLALYYADQDWTVGRAMVAFSKALNNRDEFDALSVAIAEWVESQNPDPGSPGGGGYDPTEHTTQDRTPVHEAIKNAVEDIDEGRMSEAAVAEVERVHAAEQAEEQEQPGAATNDTAKITSVTQKHLAETVKTFPGAIYMTIASKSFRERATLTIKREISAVSELTEAEAWEIIKSLNSEKMTVNPETGATFAADNEKWFRSPERAMAMGEYNGRIRDKFTSPAEMSAWQEEHTGVDTTSKWHQEHFDKANAALDREAKIEQATTEARAEVLEQAQVPLDEDGDLLEDGMKEDEGVKGSTGPEKEQEGTEESAEPTITRATQNKLSRIVKEWPGKPYSLRIRTQTFRKRAEKEIGPYDDINNISEAKGLQLLAALQVEQAKQTGEIVDDDPFGVDNLGPDIPWIQQFKDKAVLRFTPADSSKFVEWKRKKGLDEVKVDEWDDDTAKRGIALLEGVPLLKPPNPDLRTDEQQTEIVNLSKSMPERLRGTGKQAFREWVEAITGEKLQGLPGLTREQASDIIHQMQDMCEDEARRVESEKVGKAALFN